MTPQQYFSDVFCISPEVIANYGALDISLINDLPLFVDPFLLYESEDGKYLELHDELIRYVTFLRDVALQPEANPARSRPWFRFPEVRQNWLGFSKKGNGGTGLGANFARVLKKNLAGILRDFGTPSVSRSSHLEKVCLLDDSVGRDHLSDFIVNITKFFFLEYTQAFAKQHLKHEQIRTFPIDKVRFSYDTQRWARGKYLLPVYKNDFVLLTPRDMLTKDVAWINRKDMLSRFQDIHASIDDQVLRAQIEEHLFRHLPEHPKARDRRLAAEAFVAKNPRFLDFYIRTKEDNGQQARRRSMREVESVESHLIFQIRDLTTSQLDPEGFYQQSTPRDRLEILEKVIEDKEGSQAFYIDGERIKNEHDLKVACRLLWHASGTNVPSPDFKLASNTRLYQYLANADPSVEQPIVIFAFRDEDLASAHDILKRQNLLHHEHISLIYCRSLPSDNDEPADEVAVLFVAASNSGQAVPLRLAKEERIIRESLDRARVGYQLATRQDANVDTLAQALLDDDYTIVHIAAHGTPEGLVFGNSDTGESTILDPTALGEMLGDSADGGALECVVLSACGSHPTGLEAADEVPITITMEGPIDDEDALIFAKGFYDAIGAGKRPDSAYRHAMQRVGIKSRGSSFLARMTQQPND